MAVVATLSLIVLFVIALTTLFNLQMKLAVLIEEVKNDDASIIIPDNTDVFMGTIGNNVLSSFETLRHVGSVIGDNIFNYIGRIGSSVHTIDSDTGTRARRSTDIQRYTDKNGTDTGIFFVFFVCITLYILMSKVKDTLRKYANQSTHTEVLIESTEHARPAQTKRSDAERIEELLHENERRGRVIYEKIFGILEEASYLSEHNNLTMPRMVRDPMLKDVAHTVEILQKYIHEGVLNMNLMSQEYMKQNAELLKAEGNLQLMHKYKDVIENESELLQCLSKKDKKIARLQEVLNKLKAGMNHFSNDRKLLRTEFSNMTSQLENERVVHKDMLQLHQKSMEEENEIRKFLNDELQVEMELNKVCEEEYARNVHCLVKKLLLASNAEDISLDAIESFVESDLFSEFLATKDFSEGMSENALFKELHHLAITYSNHLNRLN